MVRFLKKNVDTQYEIAGNTCGKHTVNQNLITTLCSIHLSFRDNSLMTQPIQFRLELRYQTFNDDTASLLNSQEQGM